MKYLEDNRLWEITADMADCPVGTSRVVHGRLEAYTMKRTGSDKKYAQVLGEKYVAWQESLENLAAELPALQRSSRKRSQSESILVESTEESKPVKQARRARANSVDVLQPAKATRIPVFVPAQASRLGDVTDMGTRRLTTDLILTLNLSFPDYDFGSIRPGDFVKHTVPEAIQRVNKLLSEIELEREGFLSNLWSAVDEVVSLEQCVVYSYQPVPADDSDDDPMSFLTESLVLDEDMSAISNESQTILWSFNYFFVNKSAKRIVFFPCIERMREMESAVHGTDDVVEFVQAIPDTTDVDFDLDPSAPAGGIPISTI